MIDQRRNEFAASIADYVATHPKFATFTPHEGAYHAVLVLLDDIGAAQGLLDVLGIDLDLYTTSLAKEPQ